MNFSAGRMSVRCFFHRLIDRLRDRSKILSLSGNMTEAAANLYTAMQELDAMGLSAIIATLPEATGIGSAVNDRLRKASFKTGQPQTEHAKTPTRSPHS